MVFHDYNTLRITGESYNVPETDAALLRTLNIGKGEKMPFLSEVLKILPEGKTVYLDLKWYQYGNTRNDNKLIDKLILQIEKSNRIDDCVIICFDPDYLYKIKLKKPELKCLWIAHEFNTMTQLKNVFSKYNFDGINAHWNIIDYEMVKYLKSQDKSIYVWVINDKQQALNLYKNHKINGILTNRPDFIRQVFLEYFN
jgi:glycerophosphoryl diester phosphodiesterase